MSRNIHMCANIEGLLKRSDSFLGKLFNDDGKQVSGKRVREWLKQQLAEGKRVIPCGTCDNFDYQTGCRGHEVPPQAKE